MGVHVGKNMQRNVVVRFAWVEGWAKDSKENIAMQSTRPTRFICNPVSWSAHSFSYCRCFIVVAAAKAKAASSARVPQNTHTAIEF